MKKNMNNSRYGLISPPGHEPPYKTALVVAAVVRQLKVLIGIIGLWQK
jgi:hypothetical protein